jgi:hypothetical protein
LFLHFLFCCFLYSSGWGFLFFASCFLPFADTLWDLKSLYLPYQSFCYFSSHQVDSNYCKYGQVFSTYIDVISNQTSSCAFVEH